MIDKNTLLNKYSDNLSNSPNRNAYLRHAQAFLDNTGGLDKAYIDAYIATLRKRYSPGTVNLAFRVIRRLYAVNGLPWEYRRGEAPVIKQRDEYRPQLSQGIIETMIRAARLGRLLNDEQCFLALSTTYGLRRGELNLRPGDVDLKSNAIYVATLKFGRERYHLIPPQIRPAIEAHDFGRRYGMATLSVIFNRILIKATRGQLKAPHLGWHSIRRAVFQGLIRNGVDLLAARAFMRWKSAAGDMAMPARYYGNVVVGLATEAPVLDEAKGDEEIFAKHPFLPFWR